MSHNKLILSALLVSLGATTASAQAADLSVRPYLRTLATTSGTMSSASASDVTGSIQSRQGPATGAMPTSAAVGHAHAARARFSAVRTAADQALMLRDDSIKTHRAKVEGAMSAFVEEMKAVERTTPARSAEIVKKADAMAQDWYRAAYSVINPPPGGLTAIAMPTALARKADAATAALDQMIEDATARAAVASRQVKRPRAKPQQVRPVAAAPAWSLPQ